MQQKHDNERGLAALIAQPHCENCRRFGYVIHPPERDAVCKCGHDEYGHLFDEPNAPCDLGTDALDEDGINPPCPCEAFDEQGESRA